MKDDLTTYGKGQAADSNSTARTDPSYRSIGDNSDAAMSIASTARSRSVGTSHQSWTGSSERSRSSLENNSTIYDSSLDGALPPSRTRANSLMSSSVGSNEGRVPAEIFVPTEAMPIPDSASYRTDSSYRSIGDGSDAAMSIASTARSRSVGTSRQSRTASSESYRSSIENNSTIDESSLDRGRPPSRTRANSAMAASRRGPADGVPTEIFLPTQAMPNAGNMAAMADIIPDSDNSSVSMSNGPAQKRPRLDARYRPCGNSR